MNGAEANKDTILSTLGNFNCHLLFADITLHQQMNLLNTNHFKNFVPNKFISCNDRDPPLINGNIKNQIKWKNGM